MGTIIDALMGQGPKRTQAFVLPTGCADHINAAMLRVSRGTIFFYVAYSASSTTHQVVLIWLSFPNALCLPPAFHEDWPCASPNGTVASHTVAEIMDWAAAANGTTCLEQGDVYTTMGCNDGVVTWLFYDGDNDDCSGEWSGIIKPSPNCYGLAADGQSASRCKLATFVRSRHHVFRAR